LGTVQVRCSLLVQDSFPLNDTLSKNVTVLAPLVDFSPMAIATPPIVHLNDMVIAAATLHANGGNPETETVAVRLRIGSFYDDTASAELDPGEYSSVAFKPWQADSLGTFQLRCSLLVQDSAPANDTLSRWVTVYPPGSDFAVQAITSPPDSVPLDSQVVPTALVHAAIYNQSESVSVRMKIGAAYDDTVDTVIPANAAINVTFPSWQAQPLGTTTARCTLLTADNDSTNNTQSRQVHVFQHSQPGGPPAVQWTKTFAGMREAEGTYVEQTTDGGYFVAGTTSFGDTEKLFLVKTTSNGNTSWTKTVSGPGPLRAFSAQQTSDGGYIVGVNGPPARMERWHPSLMKFDGQGNLVWQNDINGGVIPYDVFGNSVLQTSDGGYAVVANMTLSDSAVILFKTDSLGKRYHIAIEWGTYDRFPLCRTSDGGFLIGTRTLLKVDSLGNQQWLRTFGFAAGANSVLQIPDGGYVATGPTNDCKNIYLFKTDTSGALTWSGQHAHSSLSDGYWVERTADGGFVVAGNYWTEHSIACIIRTTSSGTHMWTDSLFLGGAECIRRTQDGGYIVTGLYHVLTSGYGSNYLFLTKLAPEQQRKPK
jgi:hypothetical protein